MKILETRSTRWTSFLLVGFLLTGIMWAVSSPPGSSFDETYHIGSIWCSSGFSYQTCEPHDGSTEENPTALTPFVSDYCFYQGSPANCEDHGTASKFYPHRFWEGKKDYRNIYYRTMFLLASSDTRRSILYMRLFNVLVFSVLLVLTLAVIRNQLQKLLLLGLVLSVVPQGIFLVSSINPSGWTITGLMFFWVLIISLLRKEFNGPRWFILMLLTITFGMCTSRLEGPYYLLVTALAVVGFQYVRSVSTRIVITTVIGGALLTLSNFGGRFFDEIQNSLRAFHTVHGPNFNLYWLFHLVDIPALSFGQNFEDFGPLGGGDILVPPIVPIIQISAIVMALYFANRKFLLQVTVFQIFIYAFLYMTLIRLLALEMTYNAYWVQGRYILPLVPFIIGYSLYLSGEIDFSQHRHPIRLAVFLFSVSHAVTLMTIIVRFTNGTVLDTVPWPTRVFQLDTWRYVSWLPSGVIWTVGVSAYSVFLWAAYRIITAETTDSKQSVVLNARTMP